MSAPVFLDHLPHKNFIGIQVDSVVFFRIEDPDGLDLSTLTVTIEGSPAITNGVYQAGYSGVITNEDATPTAVSIVINPDTDFNYSLLVNVAIIIRDQLGNYAHDAYEFLTVTDPGNPAPVVVVNPHGGLFSSPQNITLTSSEPGTTIRYTLDGTDPDLSSAIYTVPINIAVEGTTTLKFFGVDTTFNSDIIRTEQYIIDLTAPVTTASPTSGSYFNSQTVELTCDDSEATIYYTTDESTPTTNSTIYSVPITLQNDTQTTIKFFAVDKAGNVESVKTEIYTIETSNNNIVTRNVFVTTPFNKHALDIRWDDMYHINTDVRGYNIYRADVEMGPYVKINSNPITITQYEDRTLDLEILEEDVSDQFKRTVNINTEVNDDFEGERIDEGKWNETDPAQFLFQYNSLVFIDNNGLSGESKLTSKFKLRNDFNIQIDYLIKTWNKPSATIQACIFRVTKSDGNYIQISRSRSDTQDIFAATRCVNGNPDLPTTTVLETINAKDGKFKIARQGSTVRVYYLNDAGAFVELQNYISSTDDMYVEIIGNSADTPIEFDFNHFILNDGYPIIVEPLSPTNQYFVQTSRYPIVDDTGTGTPTDKIDAVTVTIDGVAATIRKVRGKEGCIELETERQYDEIKREFFQPVVPNEFSKVLVTYKTRHRKLNTALRKRYFYKVSTLTETSETDLDLLTPEYLKSDKITYIYEECIRRNSWLLDQAGERVLLYIKKKAGQICPCMTRDVKQRSHRRADYDCTLCFGSGFIGGFDGPFPIIVAPLTTEQRLQQMDRGLKLAYQIETWTLPTPLIQQRDLILRRNGDRCLVGPMTAVEGPDGVIVQQHFTIEILDTTDIRYKFGVHPLPDQTQQPGIDKPGIKTPEIHSPKEREELITQKGGVDRIKKGRSFTFSNKLY